MAQFILHTPAVWSLKDLKLSEKTILNYLWAWKSRGNPITVQSSYLSEFYCIPVAEVELILQTIRTKRYIDITHYTQGWMVIYCLPLNEPKAEDDNLDVFDHLY